MKTKTYLNITYQLGMSNGYPVMETLTIAEQKEIERAGLNVQEIIDANIACYKNWE